MDKDPVIITFYNIKGGVGKTTLSNSLYFSFKRTGHRVSFVELDEQGGSDVPYDILSDSDVVIIDTPARKNDATDVLVQKSNLVIVPTRDGPKEGNAVKDSLNFVEKNNIPHILVFNEADLSTNSFKKYRDDLLRSEAVDLNGVPVICVPHSVDFKNAYIEGFMDVMEYEPNKPLGRALFQLCNQARMMTGFEPEPPVKKKSRKKNKVVSFIKEAFQKSEEGDTEKNQKAGDSTENTEVVTNEYEE